MLDAFVAVNMGGNSSNRQLHRIEWPLMDRLIGLIKNSRRAPQARSYSVIIAAYNAATHIERCLRSLLYQALAKRCAVEIIVVDDGSTDGTAALAQRYARKHSTRLRVLRKDNGGPASARNLGLTCATGDWVTFVDADDFVARNYFAVVDEFLDSTEDDPSVVCANVRYYYERSGRVIDAHPLRFRFLQGPCTVDVFRAPKFLHLAAAQSFFKRAIIEQHGIRFSELIVPIFEDAHFTAKYLCLAEKKQVAFLPDARYFYRKRRDSTSLVTSSWSHPGRYAALLEHGYLDILRYAKQHFGVVPMYLQNLVLYDLRWLFVYLADHDERLSHLSPSTVERFVELLREIVQLIDIEAITHFDIIDLPDFVRCGIIETMKGLSSPNTVVVESYDERSSVLVLSHAFTSPYRESLLVEGSPVERLSEKTQVHAFAGRFFVYQRFITVRLPPNHSLEVVVDGVSAAIRLGRSLLNRVARSQIVAEQQLDARRSLTGFVPKWVHAYRKIASHPKLARIYRDSWLLMDRDIQADDNAEHLYRYLLKHRPDIDAYFVLCRKSHDWSRLKQEGFRLVRFGSPVHKLLFLKCRALVSSHIDGYIVNFVARKWFLDVLSHKFVFLQHGVTEGDLSAWINQKNVDCIITAGTPEWESIVSDPGPYRFSTREVHLTGFPRYDALSRLRAAPTRTILVMPTWRKYVVGDVIGKTNRRKHLSGFAQTPYSRAWGGLLRSRELHDLTLRFGYRVVFFPHANVEPYLDEFSLPPHVETRTHRNGSIQRELAAAAVLITDYSSVAFDAAFLERAIIYYQFDRTQFLSGEHLYSKGYFDPVSDGFGPCCFEQGDVIEALRAILENAGNPDPAYKSRMRHFFPHRDSDNCARVIRAIEATLVP